jgi:hypothetical protein
MAAAHVPLGRRSFSLRDSHCGTFECNFDNNKNCDDLRLISAGCPAGGGWIVANRGSYSASGRCCKGGVPGRGKGEGGAIMSATPITFIIQMQVTLVAAAAATALNIWLGSRIALVLQPG